MFLITKTVALVATLLSVAAASPIAAPVEVADANRPSWVPVVKPKVAPGKRALDVPATQETLYLVNCAGGTEGTQSQINYYANGRSGSQHGEQPDAVAVVFTNGDITWEGHLVTGAFGGNNGGTATCNIVSNGSGLPAGSAAGYCKNSFGQYFNCFRDNNRTLHVGSGDPNFTCRSIYFCEDA